MINTMHKLQWLRTRAFSSKVVRSQVYICWNFSARCSCVYWRTKDGKESLPLNNSNMMSVFQDFKRFSWSFMNKGLALAKWKPSIHLRVSSFYLYIFLGWDHPVTQVNIGAKQSVLLENNVFFFILEHIKWVHHQIQGWTIPLLYFTYFFFSECFQNLVIKILWSSIVVEKAVASELLRQQQYRVLRPLIQ